MVDARQIFAQASQVKVKSAGPEWTQILLQPTAEARNMVMGYLRCEIADLADELGEQLSLAADELLRNAIEHGCGDAAQCSVEFIYIRTARMIQFQIRDGGHGFTMNNVAHAAINNPPEEPLRHAHYRTEKGMRPGGFGIMLVKQIADELIYNEVGNEVVLVKYLGQTPGEPIHSAEQP
jgi:anti-sigma regulatory factor (Ser/Thr protein kinase)